jgi:predicted O-linked N-acetylglucosamine transferase (SPINDLY family)
MAKISEALTIALQHHQAGNLQAAEEIYQRILQVEPEHPDALHFLGVLTAQLGRHQVAADYIARAVAANPNAAPYYLNLGLVYQELEKPGEAIACYRQALQLQPEFAEVHYNLGNALNGQGQPAEAAACYRRALQLKPDYAEAHYNLGKIFQDQGELDEAIACYRRALQLKPDYAEAHYNLGFVFHMQRKLDEAIACYRRAVELRPRYAAALAAMVHELQRTCRWDGLDGLSRRTVAAVLEDDGKGSSAAVPPFFFLTQPTVTTSDQQLQCARTWVHRQLKTASELGVEPLLRRPPHSKPKITVGYLSGDFHAHATAWLMAELFEKHDRGRLAIYGYSYGPDDGSAMRQRLKNGFDRFVDVRSAPFTEAARRIAADEVDILVDLKGYTWLARTQIVALGPAPIQVNYLGFPGTMGASFMDYILVDDFIVPPDQQSFFTEKLVHLPGCYQVNDSQREISPHTPSRAECGLPERGFVFCCFNSNYKITPPVYDVWMKLLHTVPGSVLWLLEGNRYVTDTLRREAETRGIPAERLVFAPLRPQAEHLCRVRLADLFLDTFPVVAHTTASDALWAGCPVLTIAGETFVSRVAGSLLRSIGLPELITTSLDEYADLALRLARDPARLAELRARLEVNRGTSSLFDAGLFARGLEQAYATMWEIYARGEQPRAFRVSPT